MNLHPSRLRTYSIIAPPSTHTRPATCEEVNCAAWRDGWVSVIDASSSLGRRQAAYITDESERRYTASQQAADLVVYTFPPGQECFATHQVALERESLYLVRHGAHGHFAGARTHATAAHWVEDFAENQDKLGKLIGG